KEKALGAEIRDSRNRDSEIVRVSTGRRLTPLGESIDHPRTCREDLDFRKEIGAQRNDGNAQFSLCYRLNAGSESFRDRHFFFGCCDFTSSKPKQFVKKTFPQKTSDRRRLGFRSVRQRRKGRYDFDS